MFVSFHTLSCARNLTIFLYLNLMSMLNPLFLLMAETYSQFIQSLSQDSV